MQMHYMHYMPIYDANVMQIVHFSFFMQIIHASSSTKMLKDTMFTDTEEDNKVETRPSQIWSFLLNINILEILPTQCLLRTF